MRCQLHKTDALHELSDGKTLPRLISPPAPVTGGGGRGKRGTSDLGLCRLGPRPPVCDLVPRCAPQFPARWTSDDHGRSG